jgi:hypothetical protein
MKTVKIPSSNRQLRKMVDEAQDEAILLVSGGKPVAALVGVGDLDLESLSLGTNPKFLRILRRSLSDLKRGRRLSLTEMRRRVGAG